VLGSSQKAKQNKKEKVFLKYLNSNRNKSGHIFKFPQGAKIITTLISINVNYMRIL
jgi:hypothetical protein